MIGLIAHTDANASSVAHFFEAAGPNGCVGVVFLVAILGGLWCGGLRGVCWSVGLGMALGVAVEIWMTDTAAPMARDGALTIPGQIGAGVGVLVGLWIVVGSRRDSSVGASSSSERPMDRSRR